MDPDPIFLNSIFFSSFLQANPIELTKVSLLFFLFLSLIFLSFVISGAEVALFSLNRDDLKKIAADYRGKKILHLLASPKELLSVLIIGNTLTNIFIVLLINIRLEKFLAHFLQNELYLTILKIGIEIFVIIFFSEVLPKTLAFKQNIKFALNSLPIILLLFASFRRVAKHLNKMASFIEKKLSVYQNSADVNHIDELKHAIELTSDKEDKKEELLLISSIMDFKHKTVKQIMKSKIDIKALSQDVSFSAVKKEIVESQYSRIPVYKGSIDNIIGILNTKKLLAHLHKKTTFKWTTLLHKPLFVLENQSLEFCLQNLQEEHANVAIVVDEFGVTQGFISFEDIVEEIVGDIKDEFDEQEINIKKIDKTKYEFDAKTSIQDFATFLNIPIAYFNEIRNDSDSLAGLLLELFQTIPNEKESMIWNSLKFTILQVQNYRITKVLVQVLK